LLSAELISRIRRLELKAGHLASDLLLGEYVSAFKGRGWEFDEVREYRPGDDTRGIDWNVTARMGSPYVKVFQEERDMTLMLMVDVSSSLYFASQHRPKHEVAAELAAVLAFLATKHKDKVGLILFSDHVERYVPPSKGRAHIWSIIRSVLSHKAQGEGTDLEAAMSYLLNVRKRRSLVFLISDFYGDYPQTTMQQLASRHELVCARIVDPGESRLPDAGMVLLEDKETRKKIILNTGSAAFRKDWQQRQERLQADWQKAILRAGGTALQVSTDHPVVDALHRFLRARDVRRRRVK
jgi:uncharacterized protein (DUF58 family)